MPSLRELKKRLKSVKTIEQLSGAMRSAATAKYMKLSSALTAFSPYSEALDDMAGNGREIEPAEGRTAFVLISGSRGLCGGYHHELFSYFAANVLDKEAEPLIVTCGQKAAEFLRSRKLEVLKSFVLPDIPSYNDAKELTSFIREGIIESGAADRVVIVYQRFINMLKSSPVSEAFPFPNGAETDSGSEKLYVPDRETVISGLGSLALDADMYKILLSAAASSQAATVIAMRSAFDNAKESISVLETRINRLRQAAVTASVLETSVDHKE